jgi:hypothetical protein
MKTFFDYLIPVVNSDDCYDIESKIVYSIKEVPENDFYLPAEDDIGFKHFVLELTSESRDLDSSDPSDYFTGLRHQYQYTDIPLTFFYSGREKPSLGVFSNHIKQECRNALLSVKGNSNIISPHSGVITPEWGSLYKKNVYKFMCLYSNQYSNTEKFLEDYDFWLLRLHATLKWIAYMRGDSEWTCGYVAIGDSLYDFLSVGDYQDSLIGQYLCRQPN